MSKTKKKRLGRPPLEHPRKTVSFRTSEEILSALRKLRQEMGCNQTDVIETAIREAAKSRDLA